jgi:hypothetical protein
MANCLRCTFGFVLILLMAGTGETQDYVLQAGDILRIHIGETQFLAEPPEMAAVGMTLNALYNILSVRYPKDLVRVEVYALSRAGVREEPLRGRLVPDPLPPRWRDYVPGRPQGQFRESPLLQTGFMSGVQGGDL